MGRFACIALAATIAAAAPARADDRARFVRKLDDAREVLVEALSGEGRTIPPRLLARARAIAIFPGVVKGGFVWGGRYGEGVVLSQDEAGAWSAPAYFTLAGGSWGLQIGLQSTDVVLLVMNDRGLHALLKQKATLGADAEVAAGPSSASAEADVDVALRAEILSYTRARGLFAGVSVDGARIARSDRINGGLYGRPVTVDEILIERSVDVPEEARRLVDLLKERADRGR